MKKINQDKGCSVRRGWKNLIAVLSAAALAAGCVPMGAYAAQTADTVESGVFEVIADDALEAQYNRYANEDPERFVVVDDRAAATPDINSLTHNPRFDGAAMQSGIDVSKYQGTIDWTAVAGDDIDFAIVRAGYRGYGSTGQLVADPKLRVNMEGAAAAGLDVGLYFFTQAINEQEAIDEANFVLTQIQGFPLTLPIYYDIEAVTYASGRMDNAGLTIAQRTANCQAFCDTIRAAGYQAGVYASKSYFLNYLDPDNLSITNSIWLAHYTTQTSYKGDYDIWQFSDKGTVAGISGNVDRNVRYVTGASENLSIPLSYAESSQVLAIGDTYAPVLYGDGTVTYSSSDESIATVDENGMITALRKGTAVITAVSSNGTSASLEITVSLPVHVALNYSAMIFTKTGETETLPSSASMVNLVSTDDSVVCITDDRTIQAVGNGTAVLIASDNEGNQVTCNVVVDENLMTGDVNADGQLDSEDASLILCFVSEQGIGLGTANMTEAHRSLYDLDGDGIVTAADASTALVLVSQNGLA